MDVVAAFASFKLLNPHVSIPVAAVHALTLVITRSAASTMSELTLTLKAASQALKASAPAQIIAVSAGCDLFLHFVTRSAHDFADFDSCKAHIISRGKTFIANAAACRAKIASVGLPFIKDDATILVHSYSRVVIMLLLRAAHAAKRIRVFVTESRPSDGGLRLVTELRKHRIPAKMILDAAVGYIIEKVDMVLVGAEGVVENGGIINQIGTYQLAVVAHAAHKPFYCVAESYKFVRLFPLNQYDLPGATTETWDELETSSTASSSDNDQTQTSLSSSTSTSQSQLQTLPQGDVGFEGPNVDYTPPNYITLLFTDLGVMTPSGVSDELIRVYH